MLEIENLTIEFGTKRVLDRVSMSVERGKVLGIVGESGSGKTMTALSVMGLLSSDATVADGSIRLDRRELLTMKEKELAAVRGNDAAMIFQEPMTSLNPAMRVGKQVGEALRLHIRTQVGRENGGGTQVKPNREEIKRRVLDVFAKVRLPEPERVYRSYPHELSGGMRQRVMIAMGIICRPSYLLCDEPTTALDVTTEKQILKLIEEIKKEYNMGIVFITHDLKLLRGFADEVAVMSQGKVVERATPEELFLSPKEEYTKRLIASIPDRKKRLTKREDPT